MTPLEGLRASLQLAADEAASAVGGPTPRVEVVPHEWPLSLEAARLLVASSFLLSEPPVCEEWIAKGPTLDVRCPAGTSFDAAEALRLELVAKLPAGVTVDVQIAPSPPGSLSPEDEAGARLFASQRAERLNPPAPVFVGVDLASGADETGACLVERIAAPWDDRGLSESEDLGHDVRLFVLGSAPITATVTVSVDEDPAPSLDDPYPWEKSEEAGRQ